MRGAKYTIGVLGVAELKVGELRVAVSVGC